jgi:NADH:ubiquinone oxidoreductase subunit F (NADH-binding)/(2Fe-2S) ferredoxin/NAD-dependent dihydropyrimidine dehydrogenase PreA subunit
MNKINSLAELRARKTDYAELLKHRFHDEESKHKHPFTDILICAGTGCQASDSMAVVEALKRGVADAGLEDTVKVEITGCFGFCEKGPIVKVMPDNIFYIEVTPKKAQEIIAEHIVKGNVVEPFIYVEPETGKRFSRQSDIPFYKKQMRIALRNCGLINPEDIRQYIAVGGFEALGKTLFEMNPELVIAEVTRSGLRGRGGGGFPTGAKWGLSRKSSGQTKYIICNADEGDPGAFMDRSILEGDPNSVLEGMAICGYSVGSNKGYIYIRAEYPLAIARLRTAIKEAYASGLLGKNILGSDFSFDIDLKYGAGAFVCGEETALISSIEGERGEPTFKPPFPAEVGLWKKPTNINNVETFANISPIILNGADWFSKIGTEKSKGTKVFALAGKINNVGLVEVPMGTSLREIIYNLGGGIKDHKKFKAVQTGGPSGGCIPAGGLDTPIDYDSLTKIGSMMGSGGMIVMDEDNCMVNIAKFYMEFMVEESCGKCTACRIGNKRLYEILTEISDGKGTMEHLAELKELGSIIKDASLCGLGQTAPNPVLSTMNSFWDEYVAHVKDKRCPAGVCTALLNYHIESDKCKGCTACSKVCPVQGISGTVKGPHTIDKEKCIKCGACAATCKFNAITRK